MRLTLKMQKGLLQFRRSFVPAFQQNKQMLLQYSGSLPEPTTFKGRDRFSTIAKKAKNIYSTYVNLNKRLGVGNNLYRA